MKKLIVTGTLAASYICFFALKKKRITMNPEYNEGQHP